VILNKEGDRTVSLPPIDLHFLV